MSPGHFRIPGHSGTAIKHRKGFLKQKELLHKKQRTSGWSTATKNAYYKRRTSSSPHPIVKVVFYVLLFGGIISGGLLVNSIVSSGMEYHRENWQIQQQNQESKKAFYFSQVRDAQLYLREGKLEAAQYEFALALSIIPDGKAALIGMRETLGKQCHQLKVNCEAAKTYTDYTKAKGW